MTLKTEITLFSLLVGIFGVVAGSVLFCYRGTTGYQFKRNIKKINIPQACAPAERNLRRLFQESSSEECEIASRRLLGVLTSEDSTPEGKAAALQMLQLGDFGTNLPTIVSCLRSRNPQIAYSVRCLLETAQNPSVDPLLLEHAEKEKDPGRASLLMNILVRRQTPGAAQVFAMRAKSSTPLVRSTALESLAEWGTHESLDVLIQMLPPRNEGEWTNGYDVTAAAIRCAEKTGTSALPVLEMLYTHTNGRLRGAALIAQAPHLSEAELWPKLRTCLESRYLEERDAALSALTYLPKLNAPQNTMAMISCYFHFRTDDRIRLLQILRARASSLALPLAKAVLRERDASVEEKIAAVNLIADLRDPKAFPSLLSTAVEKHEHSRQLNDAIFTALGVLPDDDELIVRLAANYQRYDPLRKARILRILCNRAAPQLTDCLCQQGNAQTPELAEAAGTALNYTPVADFGALIAFAKKAPPRDRMLLFDHLDKVAMRCSSPEAAVEVVSQAMQGAETAELYHLIELLGRMPSQAAHAQLGEFTSHSDPAINRAATRALAMQHAAN